MLGGWLDQCPPRRTGRRGHRARSARSARTSPAARCCCSSRWRTRTTSSQAPTCAAGTRRTARTLDRRWSGVATFVDGRAFPLFGLLFGYGSRRSSAVTRRSAASPMRRMLWRRGAGASSWSASCDAMLLYVGDILAAYGVLLLVGAWVVWWRDGWLLLVGAMFFLLTALPSPDSSSISTDAPDASMLPPDLVAASPTGSSCSRASCCSGRSGSPARSWSGSGPDVVGCSSGPREHRRLLGRVAAVGVTVSFLGAQPVALMLAGVTAVPGADVLSSSDRCTTRPVCSAAFGYAAAFALLALRLGDRARPGGGGCRRHRPALDDLLPGAAPRVGGRLHAVPPRPRRTRSPSPRPPCSRPRPGWAPS